MPRSVHEAFDLTGRVAVITGGAGLLGRKHAEAVAEMGGIPVLWDLDGLRAITVGDEVAASYGVRSLGVSCNITLLDSVSDALSATIETFGGVDILINNAANNPKVESTDRSSNWSRLERFPLDRWHADIAVGLTGAFLCSRAIGTEMAGRGKGVILNIASDLAFFAPDQRIYRKEGTSDDQQHVKPVTYSVVKAGLLGLSRHLATYWRGVRVNSIWPGGSLQSRCDSCQGRMVDGETRRSR